MKLKSTWKIKGQKGSLSSYWKKVFYYRWFYIMFLPVFISFVVFNYLPMVGIFYAFTEYTPFSSPKFVGIENFKILFSSPAFWNAFKNTLEISLTNLGLSMITCIGLALLLDEVKTLKFRQVTQTIIYIPHFISWVVVASIFTMFLSPKNGIINYMIEMLGGEPIYFLANEKWWRPMYFLIGRWKEIGWGTIIFIAALAGVDQEMYEAAKIDGANSFQRVLFLTIPAISGTILVVFILNLAKVLNLFDSVWVLQNPMVIRVSDVLGTFVYRLGITSSDYGLSTAAGLFKSIISLLLVTFANRLSKKIKGEGIL